MKLPRPGPRVRALAGLAALALLLGYGNPGRVFAQDPPYVMLQDRLDRPQDGYCIDVSGSGSWIDVRVPLNAHNCKLGTTAPDQALQYDATSGQLRFPALQVCVTAFGRAGRTLAQMPLLAQPCASAQQPAPTPFAAASLQAFDFLADGRLQVRGTQLCVVAGQDSDITFSPHDRWRALLLHGCSDAPAALSRWRPPPAR